MADTKKDTTTAIIINMNIKEKLKKNIDLKYQKFTSTLIPNVDNILGIRVPILRKISKEIIKEDYLSFIKSETEFFEETMLQAMVIGLIKDGFDNVLNLIKDFVPKINNWSVCDCFCQSLKITKNNKEKMWKFIKPYSKSKKEFEIRFFLVMALTYFVEEKYLNEIFDILNKIKLNDYYAQMGAGWLVSIIYINYPDECMKFLLNNNLNSKTHNLGIRKIIESNKIDKETKEKIKTLKKG